jgi:Cof subfamily protein (haloacid dehalogenase superfamily)
MNQKYIFLDIDGTLFDPITRSVPASTLSALRKAKENGHKLVVCTGRSHSETLEIRGLGIEFDAFVCSSGAVVEVGEKVIYESFIDNADIPPLTAFARSKNTGYVLEGKAAIYLDDLGYQYFENLLSVNFGSDMDLIHEKMRQRRLLTVAEYDKARDHICKVVLIAKEAALVDEARAMLSEKFTATAVVGYDADFISLEINLKEINKATGIEKILTYFGADSAETIAYGDSLNDVAMLKFCKIGVCMENGDENLKAIADDITAACDKDGIYQSFEKYGLI